MLIVYFIETGDFNQTWNFSYFKHEFGANGIYVKLTDEGTYTCTSVTYTALYYAIEQ